MLSSDSKFFSLHNQNVVNMTSLMDPEQGRMLVPGTGLEPARLAALDPKSSASANSAIPAIRGYCIARLTRDIVAQTLSSSGAGKSVDSVTPKRRVRRWQLIGPG
jgi:hypothetical protein